MKRLVTDSIFASSLECTYKCYLQLNGHRGSKSEYEKHIENYDRMFDISALKRIFAQYLAAEIQHGASLPFPVIKPGVQILMVKRVEVNGLQSDSNLLILDKKNNESFEPVLFHRYDKISPREKLVLAYRVIVIGKAWGIMPTRGRIIHGEELNTITVMLSPFIPKVEQIIHSIEELWDRKEPPFFLCNYCDICEFLSKCRSKAVEEDNLSLLQGVRRGHIEELNNKGIFTLHQFSHIFRPRRTPKRAKNPSKPRHFALQAQAIRENKVYIHGKPELASAESSIYFDIEGIPGNWFYYLIGMLTVSGEKEAYQFFWAESKSKQVSVFTQFCEAVAKFPGAALFHYGQYDVKALREIKDSLDNGYSSVMGGILNSCHNVLSVFHSHCYFPLYSNRLRDVARFLGYEFKGKIISGLGSIVFRECWEKTGDNSLKEALIAYNREDCEALMAICNFIRKSTALALGHEKVPGRNEGMVSTESLRKTGEGNRPVYKKAEFALPEFELVNKCAYFDYQRDRVFARTKRLCRKFVSKHVRRVERQASLSTVVSIKRDKCPECGSAKIICKRTIKRWLIDL